MAALLPDIDHPKSKGTQLLNMFVFVICLFLSISYFTNIFYIAGSTIILYILYILLYTLFKPRHRGITHSFFALGVITVISLFYLKFPYLLFIPLGYLSHLFADGVLKVI